MKNVQVLWISCNGLPVGIVKAYDEIEKRWHYYIGVGQGFDEQQDIQTIMAWGQKFYSLDFIQTFCKDA